MNNQEIELYFENLAQKHRRIVHSKSNKRFFRLELEDILLDKLKHVAYYPFISLERMDFKYLGSPAQKGKRKTIAFDIVDKCDNTAEKINAAYDKLEDIADDFILKIWHDSKANAFPFEDIDWNSIDAAQIPYNEVSKIIGIRIVLDVLIPISNDVNENNWQ